MASDTYGEQLDEMIQLFQSYKSGSITLDNITKLCQTLGLESFIDDIDPETSRLSTASKIIVIDIDFAKRVGMVTDVKLVLASNFDNFNYFIDHPTSSTSSNNVLLNSLTQYPDLHEFHHNLKFLYLLDNYSNIDVDASNTVNNSNVGGNNSAGTITNDTNNSNNNSAYSGKLDLFKYYTELTTFIRQYLADSSAHFKVETNLNNRLGIYITAVDSETPVAKIYPEKSKDRQQRLYEYIYTEGNKDWINESPESYTCGVSLVMEIQGNDFSTWFPQDFIPQELILEESSGPDNDKLPSKSSYDLNDLIISSKSNTDCDGKFQVMNDFTSKLVGIKKFEISNDNLDLILEILNWVQWSEIVLQQVYTLLIAPDGNQGNRDRNAEEDNNTSSSFPGRRPSVSMGYRRRRHSNKNRRPSLTEAAMLKDEGFQQFNLHEIMTDPVVEGETSAKQETKNSDIGVLDDDKMDVDQAIVDDDDDNDDNDILQLIISEDYLSLDNIAHCNLYDERESWYSFIDLFKKHIS